MIDNYLRIAVDEHRKKLGSEHYSLGCSITNWKRYFRPKYFRYFGPEHLVLEHGRYWLPQPLPPSYKRGPLGRCGQNSWRLALRHEDLTYVEGFALPQDRVNYPHVNYLGHSWAVDPEGRVVDNTWPEAGTQYFGVPIRTAYLRLVSPKGPRGTLLDNWRDEFPMLHRGLRVRIWKSPKVFPFYHPGMISLDRAELDTRDVQGSEE